jgi:hypothetical protein
LIPGFDDSLRALKRRLRRVPRHTVQIALPKVQLEGAAVAPDLLHVNSVVYSVSADQVSRFDRALIGEVGCMVHAVEHGMRSDRGRDDTFPLRFVLHSANGPKALEPTTPEAPVLARMQWIMRQLGHTHMDLLRLDVDGAEYDAIEALAQTPLRPCQMIVTFHHHRPDWSLWQTERALSQLNELGYRIFDCQESGRVFSLALV